MIAPAFNGDAFGHATVWTPSIDRMVSSVGQWIRMDQPGGIVYGLQRTGKTVAVAEYLLSTVSEVAGMPLGSVFLSAYDTRENEREFVQELLLQVNLESAMHRDLAVLRHRLFRCLSKIATDAATTRLLVVVDEAQVLSRTGYKILVHCFNSLEALGIQPFFLLVGEPRLRDQARELVAVSAYHLVGRFFGNEHCFEGISRHEIRDVLEQFDRVHDESEGKGGGRMMPPSYALDWRVRDLAPHLEHALELIAERHRLGESMRIPMHYFRSSVIRVIDMMSREGSQLSLPNSAMALQAITETGFVEALGYYAMVNASPGRAK